MSTAGNIFSIFNKLDHILKFSSPVPLIVSQRTGIYEASWCGWKKL